MENLPKCSFRIMGLSESNLSGLENKHIDKLEKYNYRKGSDYKNRSKKSLILLLNEKIKYEFLQNLIDESLSDISYDFFISVCSDEQTAIIDIPQYILDLYKEVGGKMCFSYTCIFEPEE